LFFIHFLEKWRNISTFGKGGSKKSLFFGSTFLKGGFLLKADNIWSLENLFTQKLENI